MRQDQPLEDPGRKTPRPGTEGSRRGVGRSVGPPHDHHPAANGGPTPRRRGRPVGSVSLTEEIQRKILAYIRAGAFAWVAAEAAGVSERTFHDWMARGEDRHPSRPSTPKLHAFAGEVRTARAEARIGAEVRVYREHPARWLSRVARSRPGQEGWTDLPAEPEPQGPGERLVELIRRLDEREEASRREQAPCSDPDCRCANTGSNGRRYRREPYGD